MVSYEIIDYRTNLQFFINFCFGRQFPMVYRWLLEYRSYFVAIFLPGTTFLQSMSKKCNINSLKPCVMVSVFDDTVSEWILYQILLNIV